MNNMPDDRISHWEGGEKSESPATPRVFNAALLADGGAPFKSARLVSRSGFLAGLASLLSIIGLGGCAYFLMDKGGRVRRNRYQYCSCVPVCVCDLVCTCDSQCTCQSQGGGGGGTICTCNPYWYPN